MIIRIVFTALGVLLLGAGAIAFLALKPPPTQTVMERIELLSPSFDVLIPEGDGPFPFVLLVHGCGGLVGTHGDKEIMNNYASEAQRQGYIAIVADSFSPRSIGFDDAIAKVCTGLKLRGKVRAGDVQAAYQFAQTHPQASQSGHVIAGWSHGGWSVMELMTMNLETSGPVSIEDPASGPLTGLEGVYLTYPYCGFPATADKKPWVRAPKTSIVLAEFDTVVSTAKCAKTLQRMDRDHVPLEVEVLKGVTHAFDENDQSAGSNFKYDEENAARAIVRFSSYLADLRSDAEFPNPDRFFVDVAGAEKFE